MSVKVIGAVLVVTTVPPELRTSNAGCTANTAPGAPPLGSTVHASFGP